MSGTADESRIDGSLISLFDRIRGSGNSAPVAQPEARNRKTWRFCQVPLTRRSGKKFQRGRLANCLTRTHLLKPPPRCGCVWWTEEKSVGCDELQTIRRFSGGRRRQCSVLTKSRRYCCLECLESARGLRVRFSAQCRTWPTFPRAKSFEPSIQKPKTVGWWPV